MDSDRVCNRCEHGKPCLDRHAVVCHVPVPAWVRPPYMLVHPDLAKTCELWKPKEQCEKKAEPSSES